MHTLNLDSLEFSRHVRRDVLQMVARAKASHVGSCFSCVDILSVLYSQVMRFQDCEGRSHPIDKFIMSKGHAAAAVYATLANAGVIGRGEIESYGKDGSQLMTHVSHKVRGVEFSSGSLGHGLPFGVGKALGAKRLQKSFRTFVMLSDGELDEGSNWEAVLFAAHHNLDNLIVVVDFNGLQSLGPVSETLALEPLGDKFLSFGWSVNRIDGHDHSQLRSALLSAPRDAGKPSVLIADTVKGKGVSFMEGKVEWHYRSPSPELLDAALMELSSGVTEENL